MLRPYYALTILLWFGIGMSFCGLFCTKAEAKKVDVDCVRKIARSFKKPYTKKSKIRMLKLVRKKCVRKGKKSTSFRLNCKRFVVYWAKIHGFKQTKKILEQCDKVEAALKSPPSHVESCYVRVCYWSKRENICVPKFSPRGKVGTDFCKQYITFKMCVQKHKDLDKRHPTHVEWKSGQDKGQVMCDFSL